MSDTENLPSNEMLADIDKAGMDLVLRVENLVTNFYTYEGTVLALDRVNLFLRRGDTMGVVGETGCGKSVTAKSILRLVELPGRIEEGKILLNEKDRKTGEINTIDILDLTEKEMLEVRGRRIAIVFQDPATFPNPVFRVGTQISEVIKLHQDLSEEALEMRIEDLASQIRILDIKESDRVRRRQVELKRKGREYDENEQEKDKKAEEKYIEKKERLSRKMEYLNRMKDDPPEPPKQYRDAVAMRRAIQMLEMVKMPAADRIAMQYPHELSGGMRQRALIAMALSCNPSILICDEATTALDVTVQAQVLNLLNELKSEIGSSIMIITHDLGVVAETCNWVNVMYAGTTVESASTKDLFERPMHPYTGGLLQAIPKLHEDKERLDQILGTVPNLINPPSGCRFHPRCDFATDICKTDRPDLRELRPMHFVACHHPQGDY